jgi:hypothetical protein
MDDTMTDARPVSGWYVTSLFNTFLVITLLAQAGPSEAVQGFDERVAETAAGVALAPQPVDTTSVTTSVPSWVSTATLTRVSMKSAVAGRSSPSFLTIRSVNPAASSVAVASATDSPTMSGAPAASVVAAGAVSSGESSLPQAETPSDSAATMTTTSERIALS